MIKIIDPVMIKILSLEIRWYGFLIISSLIISLFILKKLVKAEKRLNFEFFLDFLIMALPGAIIGARIYYVLFKLDYYLNRPSEIIAIQKGGLAIHGALIAGILILFLLSRKREVSFLRALDYLSTVMVLGQSIGRWGNFINREAYGRIVEKAYFKFFPEFIKNQMYINDAYREPTFLYESAADFMIFIFLFYYLKSDKGRDGDTFAFYLILYSVFRFFIEGLRTDSLMFWGMQIAQIMSIIMIILGAAIIYLNRLKNREG